VASYLPPKAKAHEYTSEEHCLVRQFQLDSVSFRTARMSSSLHNTAAAAAAQEDMLGQGMSTASGYLDRLFSSCADDPKGSIHRAWGVSLIFVILYFVVSMFESK
jgi:hypothetical protein